MWRELASGQLSLHLAVEFVSISQEDGFPQGIVSSE